MASVMRRALASAATPWRTRPHRQRTAGPADHDGAGPGAGGSRPCQRPGV